MNLKVVVLCALACLTPAVHAQCDQTVAKIQKLLTNFLAAKNLNSLINILIDDLSMNQSLNKTCHYEYECFTSGGGDKCIVNQLIKAVPITKYMTALSVMGSFTSCVKNSGSTLEALLTAVSKPFINKLNPPYNQCSAKYQKMKKNNKPIANIRNQVCTIANAAFNKKFVQTIVTACKNKVNNPKLWKCVTDNAPKLMTGYSLYNW